MPPTLSDSPGFPRPPGPPQTLSRFSSDITKRITVVTFTGPAALHTSPAPPHPTDFIKIHFRHLNFPDALFLPIRKKKKKSQITLQVYLFHSHCTTVCLSHKTVNSSRKRLSSSISQAPGMAPDILKTKYIYHPRY